jgi:hypothetical protein
LWASHLACALTFSWCENAQNKVESSAVMEYDVESVIHPTSGGASKVLRPSLDTQPTAVSSRRHYPLGF